MVATSVEALSPPTTLTTHVGRTMEFLWLLTAALVPLIFVPKDFMLSEAVNAYVEVPKTTGLRTLIGIMAILWILEWVLKGGLGRQYSIAHYSTRIKDWLVEQPSRWIVVAAVAYLVVALISTTLSVSLLQHRSFVSVWGEVSGQFGYSLYTLVSYFMLFAIIATHLKTRAQLWRLLGVIVVTGALVATYGIIQHYDLDPLNQGEAGSIRVASTMANSVFTGAVLVGTSLMTLGVGRMALERWGWSPLRIVAWVAVLAAQFMALYWTGSRGSWLIGAPIGVLAFLNLPLLLDAIKSWAGGGDTPESGRSVPLHMLALLGLLALLDVLVLVSVFDFLDFGTWPDLPYFRLLLGLLGLLGWLSAIILLYPARFADGACSVAKSILVLASALLVTILVVALTPFSPGTPAFDLKDLSGFPNSQLLLVLLGLLATPSLLVVALPARTFALGMRDFAKSFLIGATALLIVLLALTLTPAFATDLGREGTPAEGFIQEGEAFAPVPVQSTERGLSYRTDIWGASWGLIINRPWFEYEELSYSFLRPLIGYGPEMFKYTFPLETRLGGLLSHAHNFFLHHWVEQGILGLFSSLGLFIAFFSVGLAQLWRNWSTYSTTHKWILIAVLATMVGRMAEMMVGVARESDLVLIWILLAIVVALPSVMDRFQQAEASPDAGRTTPAPARREGRTAAQNRRERRAARRHGRGSEAQFGVAQFTAVALLIPLVIFLGWLTWDKNVDYLWAAATAASSRDKFEDTDDNERLQKSHDLMLSAAAKAPDVPIYYNNLASIYASYRQFAVNNPDSKLPPCAEFFELDVRDGAPAQGDGTYAECAEEAYLANLRAFEKNRTAPQVKRPLAKSTLELALLGYPGKDEEAIRYYRELTQMLPLTRRDYPPLIQAYLSLGRPEEAVSASGEFLAKSHRAAESALALLFRGMAYQRLDQLQRAIDAFETSLEVDDKGANAGEARRRLVNSYNQLVVTHLRQEQAKESLGVLERYLAIPQGASSLARGFYLQGVAYHQLGELQKAVDALEQSLSADQSGPVAVETHRQLAGVYADSGDQTRAEEHTRLYEELKGP